MQTLTACYLANDNADKRKGLHIYLCNMIPIDAYRVGDSVVLRPFCLHVQPPGMTFGC